MALCVEVGESQGLLPLLCAASIQERIRARLRVWCVSKRANFCVSSHDCVLTSRRNASNQNSGCAQRTCGDPERGKWFADAKDAKLFGEGIALVRGASLLVQNCMNSPRPNFQREFGECLSEDFV